MLEKKYSLASNTWGDEEKNAILEVLSSNNFTMGKYVSNFEDEFSKFLGVKHSIMVNSGSSANLISMYSLKYSPSFKNNGVVLAPAVSWSTTYSPIHFAGYKIRFLDIDLKTLNLSIDEVEKYLSPDVVGIAGVSLLGNPSGINILREICDKKNIFLYEDNCESFGASVMNRMAGSFGDISTHSFFFSHHLQTMEGGMISTNDDNLAMIARSLRAHGWTRDKKSGDLSRLNDDEIMKKFEFEYPGFCVRPIEFCGAVGQVQLKKWPSMYSARKKNADLFKKMITNYSDYFYIQNDSNVKSSWFGFALILKESLMGFRKDLCKILENYNIEYRPIVAGNFTKQNAIKYMDIEISGTLENANLLHENGLFVGNDSKDLSSELSILEEALQKFITTLKK